MAVNQLLYGYKVTSVGSSRLRISHNHGELVPTSLKQASGVRNLSLSPSSSTLYTPQFSPLLFLKLTSQLSLLEL